MDSQFEKMVEVNVQGRVFIICQTHGITDPTIIGYYTEILQQAIVAMLTEESTPSDFQKLLNEQAEWLEQEIGQVRDAPQGNEPEAGSEEDDGDDQQARLLNADKKATGYVPDAKSMPERLKDRRADMEQLILNDCVTLKLVSPNQAKKLKHGLLGKDPEKAEEEVVALLRNSLHTQVRKFIRKHNGGPWATATLQTEVRMDITRTRTVRSLVSLSRQLLEERQEWLMKTKNSLTGRFFGGKVKMDK
ncbi:MAG: hypothetical protein G8D61_06690 [gamma proteobacterium symbiont of Ctena orbiculata]|nr:hypothetical protein [Candidatus Thiodiazotropha taylori]MBT3058629.1 hypothetical protein [Candidatus Thiodiazotropha sp. (ex Lucina pensylvanica)]MBV2094391.1 hypothetical protein [Candidatus Thiodiazotropha sp. (ex Codakia orbicularis)]PUB72089.1 MAG: hypothetical protein DBP03_18655 [gamma proteobacterium symbiont of Ctena orbiculata]MBT3064013.1 hypothetical protein [Candidatus Thiodiazotropha sp. (ex Lucina pensylvanica)]